MALKRLVQSQPMELPAEEILLRLRQQTGLDAAKGLSADDWERLLDRAGDDATWLERALLRHMAGEPLAYVLGTLEFGGRTFLADKRAYITDPETVWLVQAVEREVRAFASREGRWPLVAEFGFGGGALGITLKLACPEIDLVGIDLDEDALVVGARNTARHGVEIELVASNLFAAWPRDEAPDFIFGDPPWGEQNDLYDEVRSADHYHAMPAASAFPVGGRTAVHEQILAAVDDLAWDSHLILNAGVLPERELERLAGASAWHRIETPVPGLALLHTRLRTQP